MQGLGLASCTSSGTGPALVRRSPRRPAAQRPGSGSSSAVQTQQWAGVNTSLNWPVSGVVHLHRAARLLDLKHDSNPPASLTLTWAAAVTHQVGSAAHSASGRQPAGQSLTQGRSGTLMQRQQ